jgi:hypothetical protein
MTSIESLSVKGIQKNAKGATEGIIKPNEILDIAKYHKKQLGIINKAINLSDNNFKDIKFIDSSRS